VTASYFKNTSRHTRDFLETMNRAKEIFKIIGPGVAIAATGVGAGDMVAAAVAGSKYGLKIAWAVIIGSILKFALTEGIARWQLATGEPILHGWISHLKSPVKYCFLVYLLIWSVLVGTALISGCGLAAHSLFPSLSVATWGIIHSLLAALIVLWGKYDRFEFIMKFFISIMFISFIGTAFLYSNPITTVWQSITQISVPDGSAKFLLGIIGGVGGTLTLLSYGYWIKEKKWNQPSDISKVRIDLSVGYFLTCLFGYSLVVLAANSLHQTEIEIKGASGVLQMATMLEHNLGLTGKYIFIVGFWAAVITSVLGVWQSIPYIFCDYMSVNRTEQRKEILSQNSKWYKGYLLYITLSSIPLLFFKKPILIIIIYSIIGALFMPFLASTLLYMNSKVEWVGKKLVNRTLTKIVLFVALTLFGYLCYQSIYKVLLKVL